MSNVETGPKLDRMSYRIIKELGRGAGSTIFQISDTKLGADYALKVVKVDAERNLILVKGAVPGANGGLILIRATSKK